MVYSHRPKFAVSQLRCNGGGITTILFKALELMLRIHEAYRLGPFAPGIFRNPGIAINLFPPLTE